MNAITSEAITRIASEVDGRYTIHPATIAYLQALVTPYAEPIETATIESLLLWLPEAFKGKMVTGAIGDITIKLATLKTETGYTPEAPAVARTAAIEYLLTEILDLALQLGRPMAHDHDSDSIWPWDVQAAIAGDPELGAMFGFLGADNTELPVEVTVGAQKFTFPLTMEFVAGLLLFSGVGNTDYNVTVFGASFTAKDVADYPGREVGSRFERQGEELPIYGVTVGGIEYVFNTANFMQGFATGAQWAGVDHHAFWSNLRQYNDPITF